MQTFRNEPTLRDYYHADYTFAIISEGESLQIKSTHPSSYISCKVQDNIDWSPNRTRYRTQRKKYEKKKLDIPIAWTLPSN